MVKQTLRAFTMSHILRPASEKTFNIADALAGIPRCIMILETAVVDVCADPRDPQPRQKARDLVRSLSSTGCPECGFRESSNILRTLEATLAFPPGGSPELQTSVAERLLDLVVRLKAVAQENRV